MPDTAPGPMPAAWRAEQQISFITGLSFSALLLLAGYIGASSQARLSDQYPWISLAVLAIACSGLIAARWLLAGFLAVRTLQRDVLARLPDGFGTELPRAEPLSGFAAETPDNWVVVDGSSRYRHRPTCVMVGGKVVSSAPARGSSDRCSLCTE